MSLQKHLWRVALHKRHILDKCMCSFTWIVYLSLINLVCMPKNMLLVHRQLYSVWWNPPFPTQLINSKLPLNELNVIIVESCSPRWNLSHVNNRNKQLISISITQTLLSCYLPNKTFPRKMCKVTWQGYLGSKYWST